MKNSEYWEKRIAEPTWNLYNTLEEKNRALLEMYQEASSNISEELYRVAEKMKTATPMLSDMHKFNRLTDLQNNINVIIKELGANVESFSKNNMYNGIKFNYKATMEALDKIDFAMPNKKLLEQLYNKPWLGSNFSERLWKNTKVLAMNLNDVLTTGLQQGKTVTEMAIQLNNRMNEGFNVAHRLVRSETMHYLNESSFKAYEDAGCEKVQLWAATDERVCPRCGIKHGNIYNMKDRPALPLHANCRCTYLPVIEVDDAIKDHDKAKEDINNEFNRRQVEKPKNSGALNDTNDPEGYKREKHGKIYYKQIKNSKAEPIIKSILDNTKFSEKFITKVYNHVFVNSHKLDIGYKQFDSDYYMAESFRRLREGKDIKEHDIIMLKHEWLEAGLEKRYNLTYREAHKLAERKYNYSNALMKYEKGE